MARGCGVGDIEEDRLRCAAGGADRGHHRLRCRGIAVPVHVHVVALAREPRAQGRADATAAAGDQGALAAGAHADEAPGWSDGSMTMLARPSRIARSPQVTRNW